MTRTAIPPWAAVVVGLGVIAALIVVIATSLRASSDSVSSANFEPWPSPIRSAFFRDCGSAEGCKCAYEQLQLRIPADEAVASFTRVGLEKFLLRDYRSENLEAVRVCLDL
jgi:hypothetical protein